jgi:hypothetical protein
MAVIGVAELERQAREIARAGGQVLGGPARAQPPGVGAQAQAGGAVEGARKVEGRTAELPRQLAETRQRVEAFVDSELHRLDELAVALLGRRGGRLHFGPTPPQPIRGTHGLVRQLGHDVLQGQLRGPASHQGQQLVVQPGGPLGGEPVAQPEASRRAFGVPRRVTPQVQRPLAVATRIVHSSPPGSGWE